MSRFISGSRFVAVSLQTGLLTTGLACIAAAPAARAQEKAPPPDFSSGQTGWIATGNITTAPGGPPLLGQDPARPYVPNNVGRQPSYRIADISNPNLKPWVRERMKKDNDEVIAGKIAFTARSSCMPAGVPAFMTFQVRPVYFIQTPRQVVIIYSGDAQVRRIYLDVPHSENPKPSWYGESVGRYEGDTLVIDTIAQNDRTFVDYYRTPHSPRLHVVERWKLIENGQKLEVTYAMDDPEAFNQPWSAIRQYRARAAADARRGVRREQPAPVRLPHPGRRYDGLLTLLGKRRRDAAASVLTWCIRPRPPSRAAATAGP
jgi:hypothetical protein